MHFLRRFLVFIQKYVYYHFIFPKLIKGGVGIRAGGLENFSKINKRGGDDYSVLESTINTHACKPTILEVSLGSCTMNKIDLFL